MFDPFVVGLLNTGYEVLRIETIVARRGLEMMAVTLKTSKKISAQGWLTGMGEGFSVDCRQCE